MSKNNHTLKETLQTFEDFLGDNDLGFWGLLLSSLRTLGESFTESHQARTQEGC
jgi:hypothetical protein